MTQGKQVVRNSLFGIVSQALGGGLFFLVTLLVARHLSPERFGAFSFVFAFVTVFQMLADFGLSNILIREMSRQRQRIGEILGAVIPLVSILALLGYAAIALASAFLHLTAEAEQAVYIMGATVLVTFHAAVYGAVCRAHEEMGFNAAGLITQRLVLLVFVLAALYLDAGLPGIALCYLGERLFQWLFFYLLVRVRYTRYRWRLDTAYWRYLLWEGLPVGAGMVLRRISWYVDTFMLMALSTVGSVGLFSAAYRVIQMVNVVPFTLSLPLFPMLSRLAVESHEKVFSLYNRAQKIFVLLGLPTGLWIGMLGPHLMALLFGKGYDGAGTTLRIMGVVAVLLFMNSLFVYLFSALGKQKSYMTSITISLLVNLLLDLVLIPLWDIEGAAIATLCSELVLYISGILLLARSGQVTALLQLLLKPTIITLLAGSVLVWPLLSGTWLSLIGGSVGFAGLFLGLVLGLRLITRDELLTLKAALPGRGKERNPARRDGDNP
jgi:O-antigen/teichoic acid export membrane protein